MMKKVLFIPKLLVTLCMVIGIGLLIEGAYKKIAFDNKTAEYEAVTGYYVDKEVYSESGAGSRHHKQTTYTLVYAYLVDGTEYTARTDYGTGAIPEPGSTKTIYYDPFDPARSVVGGTNAPAVMLFAGLMFTLIPLVFVMFAAAANGKFDKLTIDVMDLVVGAVLLILGLGIYYVIAGGFSLRELFMLAGPFGLIPILFVIVGILVIGRSVFGKSAKNR